MSHLPKDDPDGHDPTSVVESPSIETRLDRMAMAKPPAHLRQRVLAAVNVVLSEPPADETTDETQWSLLAFAAAAVLLVASWGGSLGLGRSVADAVPTEPVSLTERSASAGILLEPFTQP